MDLEFKSSINQSINRHLFALILKKCFLEYSMLLGEDISRNHQAYRRGHQPRSQALSPFPPLSSRRETLVAAGHVSARF